MIFDLLSGLANVWHSITSWWSILQAYGIAGFWMAGLVAAAVLVPWLKFNVRLILIGVAAIILLTTISFTVGIKKGADRVKADWDWALDVEKRDGENLRTDAVDAVRAEPDSVRNESPWNRDNWPKPKGD